MKNLKLLSTKVGEALKGAGITYDSQTKSWWGKEGGEWRHRESDQIRAAVYDLVPKVFIAETIVDQLGNQTSVKTVAQELRLITDMKGRLGALAPSDQEAVSNGLDKVGSKLIELDDMIHGVDISPTGVSEIIETMEMQLTNLASPRNNTMRLRNGVLEFDEKIKFSPGENSSPSGDTPYDPQATCPSFELMLNRLTAKRVKDGKADADEEVMHAVRMYIGATLFPGEEGTPNRQALWLWGPPNTGKTIFINALADTMGERYAAAGLGYKNFSDPLSALRMINKRMLCFPEFSHQLPESHFKSWTGGNPLVGKKHYGYEFEIRANGQLWFESNPPPKYNDDTGAIATRMILVDVRNKYSESEIRALGRNVKDIMKRERPGILNFMVRCWKEYKEAGQGEIWLCERLRENVARVEKGNNHSLRFLQGYALIKNGRTESSLLETYKVYQSYCAQRGQRATAANRFITTFNRVFNETVGDDAHVPGALVSLEFLEEVVKQGRVSADSDKIIRPLAY